MYRHVLARLNFIGEQDTADDATLDFDVEAISE
jgi:hypothetical protein